MLLLQPGAANLLSFFSWTFADTATLQFKPARYSLCRHLKSLSCLMESANKGGFRLFRCLKCFDILRQPRNVSVYYSGGSNTAIRAKINVKGGPRNYLHLLILPYITLSSLCISFISFVTKIIRWTSGPRHRGADPRMSNGVSPQTKELGYMGVAANDSCTTLGAPSSETNGTGRNENENVMIAKKNVMVVSHTESNEDDNSDGRSTIGEMGDLNSATVAPKVLPFHLLENITNGFSEDRKLGAGSYGNVYMGEHEDGERIAVKVLHYIPGLDEQFEKEYLNHASLQHKNIVRLVGYSHETHCVYQPYNGKMVFAEMRRRALCLEYMANGSLDKFLSDESSGHDWCTRYAIIKGICEGMQYLHEELGSPLYHLDLKPSNVLLDENMVPKIADFGLSRLGGEHTQMTKNAMGTPGYLPPEYIDAGVISIKFDIFSLGVVIIKIMTGPTGYFRIAEMSPKEFVELVHVNWKNMLQAKSLYEPYSEQAKQCIEIALRCVDADRHKRPSIGVIIDKLNEMETVLQLLEASRNDTGSYEMCPCISTECEFMDIRLNNFLDYTLHVTDNRGKVQQLKVTTASYPASETATFELIRPRIKMIDICWLEQGIMSVMDVHPTKPWILLGHSTGKISLWNHQTQEIMMKCNTNEGGNKGHAISAVKFITRMNWFVMGSFNGLIQAYSCNKALKMLNQFTAGDRWVNSLAVHPSQPLVLSACGRQIKLWNWETGWACIRTFEAHSGDVKQAKFNPQGVGNTFASASLDGTVKIWSIYSHTPISTLNCSADELKSVDYFIARGDRSYIVAGSTNGKAHIWDLQLIKCTRQIKGLQTMYNNISVAVVGRPRGHQILATVSEDNVVSFCDSITHRYENKVHFTDGYIKGFGYIESIKSLVIGYSDGFTIMEIMK